MMNDDSDDSLLFFSLLLIDHRQVKSGCFSFLVLYNLSSVSIFQVSTSDWYTIMTTVTLTSTKRDVGRRTRSLSLSLIAAHPSESPISWIPSELILDILEQAILVSKPSAFALARVSKSISNFIDIILYRTVVLDSPQTIALFHRTVRTKSLTFLSERVKRLAVTWKPESYRTSTRQQVLAIIGACTGLLSLAVPSFPEPINLSSVTWETGRGCPSELSIQSYDDGACVWSPSLPDASLFSSPDITSPVTHLRVCEPGDTWHSPSSILSSFGPLPELTHLQLSRRINSNEDNDLTFIEDVRAILHSRATLKMLVISVFPTPWLISRAVHQSNIWKQLSALRNEDSRLVLMKGIYGMWKDEWSGMSAACGPVDFWSHVNASQVDEEKEEMLKVGETSWP